MRVVRRQSNIAKPVAGQLMSEPVVTADPGETLTIAAQRMRAHRTGSLAVTVSGGVVGILTERDILRAVCDQPDLASVPVSEYMTRSPQTVDAGDDAADAMLLMVRSGWRHLPVTIGGRLAGMLSARDLLGLEDWPRELLFEPW